MAVTPSKQCIHFFRSDRWPPTSNILKNKKYNVLKTNFYIKIKNSLEMNSLKAKMRFDNARRFDPSPQHVLLRWDVIRL